MALDDQTTETAAPDSSPVEDQTKRKKHKHEDKSEATPLPSSATANQAPCISWVNPIVKPRVILLCIHGLGLYSGSYKDFGMIMSRRGVGVYAIDVRGFGSWMKSGGKQEVDFNGCLDDIRTAIASIRAANPGLPFFLLGESMGGAIALRFASQHPEMIDGLISSVPTGDRFQQKKTDLKVAVEMLKGPNKQFDIGDSIVKQATKNEKLRDDWASDPLDRMNLSPKDLMHFQKFMNENHDAAKSITKLPVLFVQGTSDRLVKPEGTWDLFNQLNTANKVFFALPSEHLVFEETQDDNSERKLKNFRLLSSWILAQAKVDVRPTDPQQSGALARGINNLVAGHYVEAKSILMALAKLEPKNADVHYWLALAYLKSAQPILAREEFARSVQLGQGSDSAKEANTYLLSLSQTSPDAGSPQGELPKPPAASDITAGKPTLLAFYAPWCQQSDKLDQWFQQARTTFDDKLKLQKINVDDESSVDFVQRFKVGPIPTLIFLTADGTISSSIIGQTSFVNIAQGIASMMRSSAPKEPPPLQTKSAPHARLIKPPAK
jgi:alpha-beta hydrolase superfamily lysophospholipase/thioredoxin-like negative regulator of GroEL